MVNIEAFKAHMKGIKAKAPEGSAAEEASEPSSEAKEEGDTGLSPGDQAMKAIKAGDSAALEEAIRRCVGKDAY